MKNHWLEDPAMYRRNLPHFAPNDAPYFITFRLAGTIPQVKLKQLAFEKQKIDLLAMSSAADEARIHNERKRLFAKYDAYLDQAEFGPTWLRQAEIAALVKNKIHALETKGQIEPYCYTIMSNHVHILLSLRPGSKPLKAIMQLLKGGSAFDCNKSLSRHGSFWQRESYDHVVREGEFGRIVLYILMNPVTARLCSEWREYPHTFLTPNIYGF